MFDRISFLIQSFLPASWRGESSTPLPSTFSTVAHRSRTSRAGNDRSAAVAVRARTMRSHHRRSMSALRIRHSTATKARRSVPESVTP